MSVGKFVVDTLVRGILSNAGAKIGTTIGDQIEAVVKKKALPLPQPPWSWTLPHNIAVAMAAARNCK